jgi:hypothetical protein
MRRGEGAARIGDRRARAVLLLDVVGLVAAE